MSNVIDFKKAAAFKAETKEIIGETKKLLSDGCANAQEFFETIQEALKDGDLAKEYPSMTMFCEIFLDLYKTDWFKKETDPNLIEMSGLVSVCPKCTNEDQTKLVEAFLLLNAFGTEEVPTGSAPIFGLATKEALGLRFNYSFPENENELVNITDAKEAMGVFYDYIYEHPDTDTDRDGGSGMLSVYGYESIKGLIGRDYVMTSYNYHVWRERGKKTVGPLLLKFEKTGHDDVYLYYHTEPALAAIEHFLKSVHNIDN